MNTKEKITQFLENHKGEFFSGEQLAKSLEISRTSVWKAVKALQQDGYKIDAVTNKGYRLSPDNDVLSKEGITKYLENKNVDIKVFRSVSSTNTVLKEMANAGAKEGSVVVAALQTAGKGRLGRSFYSPDDTGIYLSILLRPELTAEKATYITTAAAVAVCKAIESLCDKKPTIKWVNDVFLNNKKICGILTEASFGMESGKLEYAVMGAGLNVYTPKGGFPKELKDIAGSLFEERQPDIRNRYAATFIDEFMRLYKNLEKKEFFEEYKKRCFCLNKNVVVVSGTNRKKAFVTDIDENFHLQVSYEDGTKESLSSGEISIRFD